MNWIDLYSRVSEGVLLSEAARSTICYCLHPLNTVFNTHLIGFQMRSTKRQWNLSQKRSRHCFFPKAQVSGHCKLAAIHCSRSRSSNTLVVFTSGGRQNKQV